MNVRVEDLVEQLLMYASDKLLLKEEDIRLVRNRLLYELRLNDRGKTSDSYGDFQKDILDPIVAYAVDKGLTASHERLLYETRLIGLVMPLPSAVREKFDDIAYDCGVEEALKWLYDFSENSNYIRMVDINKNTGWDYKGSMGDISVTINLSKPEKDPKEVFQALKEKKSKYPLCMLCPENVGFFGNASHPSRVTLRTIPIILANEYWHFQFSPYSYFKEHCIALSDEHRPMQVDSKTYTRLLDFVELFPGYFIGSNAALPIVGGSILAHDHYQGGLKVLPLMRAGVRREYYNTLYSDVNLIVPNWYNSVIKLVSKNRHQLEECVNYIADMWDSYTDESVNIIARTTEQHNAVTPVALLEDDTYIINIILRNNRTDDEHPYGIFHPTEDLHNIKKEGIGLIEAMGKFILPGRLSSEAMTIKDYLTGQTALDFKSIADINHPMYKHMGMIAQLVNDNGTAMSGDEAESVITEYINKACEQILMCTAVFKNNDAGQAAFIRFIKSMGFVSSSVEDYQLLVAVDKEKEIVELKKKKSALNKR